MEISQVNILYPEGKATSTVNWHRGGFPFVCVVMLSNMEGTKGGETCFRGLSHEIKTIAFLWGRTGQGDFDPY